MFAYDCVYARVCSMGVIVFYKRPRNHIQMSGPDYEESEINEITKLTIDARGTGVAVRTRAIRPGRAERSGMGRRDFPCSSRARCDRLFASGSVKCVAECGTQYRVTSLFHSRPLPLLEIPSRDHALDSIRLVTLTTHCPWTIRLSSHQSEERISKV